MNRFVWDVRQSVRPRAAAGRLPGAAEGRRPWCRRSRFTVLIDPNVAADGVTVADLKEQFDHNLRMRELVTAVNQTIAQATRGAGVA